MLDTPLTKLLSKEGFCSTEETLSAFNLLKKALISTPILHLPNVVEPFIVECDACGDGLGAILTQNNQPIAYYGKENQGANALSRVAALQFNA